MEYVVKIGYVRVIGIHALEHPLQVVKQQEGPA